MNVFWVADFFLLCRALEFNPSKQNVRIKDGWIGSFQVSGRVRSHFYMRLVRSGRVKKFGPIFMIGIHVNCICIVLIQGSGLARNC